MKRPINPRSGHAPGIGAAVQQMLIFLAAIAIGWPVALPVFLALAIVYDYWPSMPLDLMWIVFPAAVIGTYYHGRLWYWLAASLKAWWTQ